ncbi:MAG: alpha-ketoacid dehydrogenase subunit beta, partial [Eubacteriales bacterium]|nr:alpha-ketoacid dehydrogenase subunit beta [Eubacteriales bacterium]
MKKTYLSAINEALSHEMERDDRVAVIGEDVGVYGGGAGATKGLIDKFGAGRV